MKCLALLVALAACGGSSSSVDSTPAPDAFVAPDRSVEQPGMYNAGTARFVATDPARSRTLTLQAWYPTRTAAVATPIEMLDIDVQRTQVATLLAAAPANCPTRTVTVAQDAPVADGGPFPVLLFSHCHSCTRLSNATTAERLATHGFIVIAVDHASDALWDHLAGMDGALTSEVLELRAADLRFALDQVAAGATPVGASADLTRAGVFGHSFGAVTSGRVAQLDARIKAAVALASPMENPLITGVTLAEIPSPLLFVVAVEDNSITEFGNQFIRNNFRDAPHEAWKIEVPDAGHWSVSDFAGLADVFAPGCGMANRQTDGTPFTYRDPAAGRALTAAYVTAFFRATLEGDAGARAYLVQATPADLVIDHHD